MKLLLVHFPKKAYHNSYFGLLCFVAIILHASQISQHLKFMDMFSLHWFLVHSVNWYLILDLDILILELSVQFMGRLTELHM